YDAYYFSTGAIYGSDPPLAAVPAAHQERRSVWKQQSCARQVLVGPHACESSTESEWACDVSVHACFTGRAISGISRKLAGCAVELSGVATGQHDYPGCQSARYLSGVAGGNNYVSSGNCW